MSYNKGEHKGDNKPLISTKGALVIGFFIAAALLTIFVPTDDETTSDPEATEIENTNLGDEARQAIEEQNKDNSSFSQSENSKVTEEKPVAVHLKMSFLGTYQSLLLWDHFW